MPIQFAIRRFEKPDEMVQVQIRIQNHLSYASQNRRRKRGLGNQRRRRKQMRNQEEPHAALRVDSEKLKRKNRCLPGACKEFGGRDGYWVRCLRDSREKGGQQYGHRSRTDSARFYAIEPG